MIHPGLETVDDDYKLHGYLSADLIARLFSVFREYSLPGVIFDSKSRAECGDRVEGRGREGGKGSGERKKRGTGNHPRSHQSGRSCCSAGFRSLARMSMTAHRMYVVRTGP